jgi:Spy/CpxP family protein refolding chaperone
MLLGAILLTGALTLPAESQADGGRGSYSHHRGGKHDFVGHALRSLVREQKDLNLSEEQVGKIKAIALDYAKTRIRGKAEVKLAEVDVHALILDEKADLTAIETALRKSESAQTALRLERVKAMRAAGAVLTPEQRDKWRASMRERHRHGRHGGERAGHYGERAPSHDRS